MSWVVLDEGKALDLAIEIVHSGDRNKDLISNVARYARLGIPEYFVYDQRRQRLYGFSLPASGQLRYESITPSGGRRRE